MNCNINYNFLKNQQKRALYCNIDLVAKKLKPGFRK